MQPYPKKQLQVAETFGHFPLGETWYETGTPDKWKFTSYERDSALGETGLDYAVFRQYTPGQGRFMNADLLAGRTGMPQSLNRYSYVLNGPTGFVDPLGLDCSFVFVGGVELGSCSTSGSSGSDSSNTSSLDPTSGGGSAKRHSPLQGGTDGPGGGGPKPKKPTPEQQQCLDDAKQDHDTAVTRAREDANHTWWVDIKNSVGGSALGGCIAGAIGGEGVGCIPGGVIGGFAGWVWGVPAGLWDANNQLDAGLARADADYQTAKLRCMRK